MKSNCCIRKQRLSGLVKVIGTLHTFTVLKARNHKSRVESICGEDGKRYNDKDVPEQFVNHFNKFLGASVPVSPLNSLGNIVNLKLSHEVAENMVREVSDEEIKSAFFDIDSSKPVRPDGYSACFYNKAWDIVGMEICLAIKEFFISGKILGEINATLIALVPKIDTPDSANCGVFADSAAHSDNPPARTKLHGGYVDCGNDVWRMQGSLGVSRAIGDKHLGRWKSERHEVGSGGGQWQSEHMMGIGCYTGMTFSYLGDNLGPPTFDLHKTYEVHQLYVSIYKQVSKVIEAQMGAKSRVLANLVLLLYEDKNAPSDYSQHSSVNPEYFEPLFHSPRSIDGAVHLARGSSAEGGDSEVSGDDGGVGMARSLSTSTSGGRDMEA
ncbi:RNA-directed DNA polymerase, eukaryota, reverse transcriptase zinc-binding domain protein [Tanacetum coccineum]